LVDWSQAPEYGRLRHVLTSPLFAPLSKMPPDGKRVSVRIGGPEGFGSFIDSALALGLPLPLSTVEMDRKNIPREVLAPNETPQNSRDISGRFFSVLICVEPEVKNLFLLGVTPSDKAKNAWLMRDEFLNLDVTDDSEWCWCLRQFLNRWGIWNIEQGFQTGMSARTGVHGFALAHPHLLRQKREEYRKALEGKSARRWLSKARPLSFTTIEEPPYFLVQRHFCEDAIEATITIDHLAGRRFGFCKRCGKQFEQETNHKKQYCDRKCIQAANVANWRAEKRKELRKAGKSNAKG
jgi:hypothetical protein